MSKITDAGDLVSWIRQAVPQPTSQFALATIMSISPITISFDGNIDDDENPVTDPGSVAYLDSYTPNLGDRVLVASIGKSWVVLGYVTMADPSQPKGYIRVHRSGVAPVPDSTWVEYTGGFDVVDGGGIDAEGQITLNASGYLVIPENGYYILIAHVQWPNAAGAYGRVLVAVDVVGLGSGGPTVATRTDHAAPFTNGIIVESSARPRFLTAGTQLTLYVWQSSGGTVTIDVGNSIVSGYRIG